MNEFQKAMLAMDNHPQIGDYRYADGSSMWLSVRFHLRMLYFSSSSGQGDAGSGGWNAQGKSLWRYILWTFTKSPRKLPDQPDILCIANYEGDEGIPNWWTCWVSEIPQLTNEALYYSHQRLTFNNIKNAASLDYYYFKNLIINKVLFKTGKRSSYLQDRNALIGILHEYFGRFVDENKINGLQPLMDHIEGICTSYRKSLYRFLKKNRPRFVLCSEGNNGDWRYNILFSVCHQLGIPTAEVQHGALGIGMVYGENLKKLPEFVNQKSDYLFTFGPYHSERSNAAGKNIALGHYRLEIEKLKTDRVYPRDSTRKRILLICEGIPATAVNNGLVNTVTDGMVHLGPEYELIVRLHPTESTGNKYKTLLNLAGSRYSEFKNENIYELLYQVDYVIGHTSTVLFEARLFDKVPLIYRDINSESDIPEALGHWFSTGREMAEIIRNTGGHSDVAAKKYFWTTGGVASNFRRFLKSENLVIKGSH